MRDAVDDFKLEVSPNHVSADRKRLLEVDNYSEGRLSKMIILNNTRLTKVPWFSGWKLGSGQSIKGYR